MEDLVSIIMPSFNSEVYIHESIESVQGQTYRNWELIVIDDRSTDNTIPIIKKYQKMDKRIRLFVLDEKGGASTARNVGIRNSKGKYIAFLDSDDLWKENKLEKQVNFMKKNNYAFSYTNYLSFSSKGEYNVIKSPITVTFEKMLKRNWIGCLTVIYDQTQIGLIQIPKIDKRNDYALWLTILKIVDKGYLLEETLAMYRLNNGISRGNKINLLKYHYKLFRKILSLSISKSLFYTLCNILNYLKKVAT